MVEGIIRLHEGAEVLDNKPSCVTIAAGESSMEDVMRILEEMAKGKAAEKQG